MKKRKQLRLKHYDYSTPGGYYVTICAKDMKCIFGKIINGVIGLNEYGNILQMEFENLPVRFKNVTMDEKIVMPNHVHMVIFIAENGKAGNSGIALGEIIRTYKANGRHL